MMLRSQPYGSTEARVLIEPEVLARLSIYRQLRPRDPESGGILLGYRRGEHLHVVDATEPHPRDRRSRFGFHRKESYHQSMAVRKWTESGQKMDYLGEWHTHPEQLPTPSSTDIRSWLDITDNKTNPMVFLIIGISNVWVGVGLGSGHRSTDLLVP